MNYELGRYLDYFIRYRKWEYNTIIRDILWCIRVLYMVARGPMYRIVWTPEFM